MDHTHSKNFKNRGKDLDDLRRRRNEVTVELRKNKRDEALLKKRNINPENEADLKVDVETEQTFSIEDLQSLVIASMSPNSEEKLAAIKTARKLLSSDKNPPIDEIIAAGILPILVDALKLEQMPLLQFEAAWALTNIASGTSIQTRKVVEEGAVPIFIQLLYSPNESVAEQSLWALGNIIGDGPDLRDFVFANGIFEPLLQLFQRNPPISFLRNLTWVIVNMCRNKNPPPSIQVLSKILPILLYFLQHSVDVPIIVDTVWTISYITDHGNEQIQMVINSDIVKYVIPLLHHEDSKIQTPALRVIGNIATGTDDQTQVILDLNVLSYMPKLLNHSKDRIKKEALWFISNITAGRIEQIQSLIDHDLLPTVIEYLSKGSFVLQKEAAWAISNMTMNGTKEQVKYLVEHSVIEPICKLLIAKDTQVVHILLEALMKILNHYSENYQIIADEIEKCGGLDTIEALQSHENEDIYKFAYELIDKYFQGANDDEIPDLVPQSASSGFEFQTNNQPNQQFEF